MNASSPILGMPNELLGLILHETVKLETAHGEDTSGARAFVTCCKELWNCETLNSQMGRLQLDILRGGVEGAQARRERERATVPG